MIDVPSTPTGIARNPAHESGQTLVVMAIFLVVLMSFVAIVIDGGMFFMQKRSIQGDADAAAMAAVRDLTTSQAIATATANEYVTTHNDDDDGVVEAVNITESGTKIQVVVTTTGNSNFNELLDKDPPTIRARATAKVQMMGPAAGMLPMAFMRDTFTVGINVDVKFDGNATGNRGAVGPQMGGSCGYANGANDFRNLIKGSGYGGIDACAMAIGSTMDTEPGNMSGPTRQGLDARINDTDSIDDVFDHDAATDTWSVRLPNSPRIGIVPVIEQINGSNAWPNGKKSVRILAYMLVYIGKTDGAGYPPYTNNGKNVWVTPLQTILPEDFDKFDNEGYMDYDPDLPAPIVYRLVE